MTDEDNETGPQGTAGNGVLREDSAGPSRPDSLTGMTLEQIIDLTGEFSHLNDLVTIHIERAGGFAGPDAYFRIVQPILDLLEVEIRIRCSNSITQQQMKLVVQDWIDEEIRACRESDGKHLI
ncbi:hypothetical protein [Methanoregula sp.]|uniref:hypothetical protein n=1 Tax=Methanoregula sp. TaxID=2052170 RepID=UPI002C8E8994|nr:hypothetical protein [Methanoregula sp.]HVP95805.1 hypothetical protein [Methanoregula sp.]